MAADYLKPEPAVLHQNTYSSLWKKDTFDGILWENFLHWQFPWNTLEKSMDNKKALVLSEALDKATEEFLEKDKSPSRKVNELDNTRKSFLFSTLLGTKL